MAPHLLTIESCRNFIEAYLLGPAIEQKNNLQNKVDSVGVELECFAYTFDAQRKRFPVKLYESGNSLMKTLVQVSEKHGGIARYFEQNKIQKHCQPAIAAIDFADGSNFQFEPGGQIEISTAPCHSFKKVEKTIQLMQQILHEVSHQTNFHFEQFGTNPWFSVDEIGMQMDKPRYRAMENYFNSLNRYGRQMMLQTCSLQVNVDTGADWTTRTKRYIAANLLAPFATAIFANSPVTAGKVNGFKSYRSYIWQHLDNSRTGVLEIEQLSGSFSKEKIVEAYLHFALHAPVIYIEDFGDEILPSYVTLAYWIANPIKGLFPTLAHFKNHLSLLFPEVRLKGYLELRSIDAPPPEWQMIPVLFYCGLLYTDEYLDKTLDLLLPESARLPLLMEQAAYGLQSDDIFKIAKKLMGMAIEGFSTLPVSYTDQDIKQLTDTFCESFTMQRKTFADDLLHELKK